MSSSEQHAAVRADRLSTATPLQRLLLIVTGLLLACALLEGALRAAGALVLARQEARNRSGAREPRAVRILCLGESTTQNGPEPWPTQLEHYLGDHAPQLKFRVLNGAVGGTNTGLILARLERQLDLLQPDVVVTMMGINDRLFGVPVRFHRASRHLVATPERAVLAERGPPLLRDLRVWRLGRMLWKAWSRKLAGEVERRTSPATRAAPCMHPREVAAREAIEEPATLERDLRHDLSAGCAYPDSLVMLALLCQRRGDDGEARDLLERGLTLHPERPEIPVLLANILDEFGKHRRALELRAIGASAANRREAAQRAADRASAILDTNLEEAEAEARRAVAIEPRLAAAVEALAQVRDRRGQLAEARELSERALTIDPDLDEALLHLSSLSARMGDPPSSMATVYRAMGWAVEQAEPDSRATDVTREHYRILVEILGERRIPLVAVQYPTLPVAELEQLVGDRPGVWLVANQEAFQRALRDQPYEALFTDHLTATFGHATREGNRLISESVGAFIVSHLVELVPRAMSAT